MPGWHWFGFHSQKVERRDMPGRQVPTNSPAQKGFRPGVPNRTPGTEETEAPGQAFNIDEHAASPWIGLHYRHEFLLHYKHELLEQHLKG
jgi:hypothetical protein